MQKLSPKSLLNFMSTPSEEGTPGSQEGSPKPSHSARGGDEKVKPVTMSAVAEAVGVSQGAISSLLNDRDYGIRVSNKTRDRVFKTCRDLGYIPNDLRAVVRIYPELGETCLLVSSRIPGGMANSFLARVAGAVMAKTSRQPASISVILYDETREYTMGDLPTPLRHGTASKVICIGAANPSICKVIHDRGLPAIFLGHFSEIPGTTSIAPDYPAAARLAMQFLVRHGHKHVGIVVGPFGTPEPRLSELNRAIANAASDAGLPIDPQDVFHGDLSFEAGVGVIEAMQTRHTSPTALLCLSEAGAAGVMAGAHARHIAVPGQLSVLAFADHAGVLASCTPLTAVVLSAEETAAMAVKEAERQVLEGIPAAAEKIATGVQLIERESCGSVKG